MPRLSEFYPVICLTTEERAWENLSQVKKNLSQSKMHGTTVKKHKFHVTLQTIFLILHFPFRALSFSCLGVNQQMHIFR